MKLDNFILPFCRIRFCFSVLSFFFASTTLLCIGAPVSPIFIINIPAAPPSGGSGDSLAPIITPDGRYVLFASSANNLTLNNSVGPAPSPLPAPLNIYLRDRLKQTTTLVSVSMDGNGAGNGDSIPAAVSTNGQFVLFESAASNLVSGDTNGVNDVFVRDLVAGTTMLASVSTNGGAGSGTSRSSVMTPDGRYVAFVSVANNLVPGDTNGIPDVFVRDLQAGTTTLISANAMPFSAASSSELPLITPDGRYVTFYSTATNFVAGVTNSGEIYVFDQLQGKTTWASTNTVAGLHAIGTNAVRSCNQAMSDNGQFIAYEACGPNGNGGFALQYNFATGLTSVISTNVAGILPGLELNTRNLTMTPDGRFVAFVTGARGANTGMAVWDSQSNAAVSLDETQSSVTNAIYDWPAITPDGRFVAFMSNATNLTANPLASGFHLYIRDMQAGTNFLVDVDTSGAGSISNLMTFPRLSDNGTIVAFDSLDGSLVPNDNNRAYDVFARNLPAGTTELISAGLPSLPSLTPNASSILSSQCVSTNGRYVAFSSSADNLAGLDANGLSDIFVHDVLTGTNYLASVNTNGMSGSSLSMSPALSGNGRFVAFTSYATGLVSNSLNSPTNIFLRDLQLGTTTLISVSTDGSSSGNGASYSPIVSDDGNDVLFFSQANNLVPGSVGNSAGNLFWRDMRSGTNRAVTAYASSTSINAIHAAMTPDGQRVAYSVQVNGLSTVSVWSAAASKSIYTNFPPSTATSGAISPDGSWIVFYETNQIVLTNFLSKIQILFSNSLSPAECQFSADSRSLAYTGGTNQIYLYNVITGSNVLVSAGANGVCDSPAVSADGRFVAYRSYASNLTANDTNNWANIFLFDSQAGTTFLITANPVNAVPANGLSLNPVFSRDGQTLLWQSWANNLAGQDFDQWCNIYALKSFSTNSTASPGGSFNVNSFEVTSLVAYGTTANASTLVWPASTGSNYQVQFTADLSHPDWQPVTNPVQVLGTQAYLVDSFTNAPQRFYRVLAY